MYLFFLEERDVNWDVLSDSYECKSQCFSRSSFLASEDMLFKRQRDKHLLVVLI